MATVASVYSKALFNVAKEQGEVKKVSDSTSVADDEDHQTA